MSARKEVRTWYPLPQVPDHCDGPDRHPLLTFGYEPGNDNTYVGRKVIGGQAYYFAQCKACRREEARLRRYAKRGGPPRKAAPLVPNPRANGIRAGGALAPVGSLLPKVVAFATRYPEVPWSRLAEALDVPYKGFYAYMRRQGLTANGRGGQGAWEPLDAGAEANLATLMLTAQQMKGVTDGAQSRLPMRRL